MMVKTGCCGFPVSFKKYLYSFDVVEVQKTFYKPPNPETAIKWRKEADKINSDFEFVIKAFQLITHPPSSPTYRKAGIKAEKTGFFRPSGEVMEAWEKTEEIARILKAKKILFQTPLSFHCSEENISNMQDFFGSIKGFILIWEPRGWDEESLMRAKERLEDYGVVHCVDPMISKPLFGDINYFRLHGRYEGRRIVYSHNYSEEELTKLRDSIGGERSCYVMFNNKNMFENAQRFKLILQQ
jgi:uncharacterized protein YecE (DUF72 family)